MSEMGQWILQPEESRCIAMLWRAGRHAEWRTVGVLRSAARSQDQEKSDWEAEQWLTGVCDAGMVRGVDMGVHSKARLHALAFGPYMAIGIWERGVGLHWHLFDTAPALGSGEPARSASCSQAEEKLMRAFGEALAKAQLIAPQNYLAWVAAKDEAQALQDGVAHDHIGDEKLPKAPRL